MDTTRLLRNRPFGEWVTVYYRPGDTGEAELLAWMKKAGCPRATLVRDRGRSVVLNPVVAPGDAVQVRVGAAAATTLRAASLPEGWRLLAPPRGGDVAAGGSYIWVQVPRSAARGHVAVEFTLGDGTRVKGALAVVRQVGKH